MASSTDASHVLTDSPDLSSVLLEELTRIVAGNVYPRTNPNFIEYSKMFNGNVKTAAKVVVCPRHAQDISQTIIFCNKYSLSLSVKAGGYGTAGWAVGGDIIVDLSKIVDTDIEIPQSTGAFTSIRDMPSIGSKGKNRAGPSMQEPASGKRRREDDVRLRVYDSASQAVASFLQSPSSNFPSPYEDQPPSNSRRRLGVEDITFDSRQISTSSSNSSGSQSSGSQNSGNRFPVAASHLSNPFGGNLSPLFPRPGGSTSTGVTTPSPPGGSIQKAPDVQAPSTAGGDPFGYLNDGPIRPPLAPSIYHSLGPAATTIFGSSTLLDSPQNLLTHATPIHPFALVTFGAGMRQKEIDQFTAAQPLEAISFSGGAGVVPYHVPFAAHPAGSAIMVLGGFGFLGRLHGLSVDNLIEAEVVLADGRIVYASESEHSDLWWALRGAGPAFGVVTRYKAKAFPVPVVFAGNLIYRFHRATAPSLIKHFRDCIKGAPRELYANVLLTAGPAGQDSLVVIQMCYVGPKEKGQEYLSAISSWNGETCLLNEVDEKSFLHQQDSVAQVLRGKAGNKWFIRSALINSLPDEIIHKTVIQFSDTPVGCTWLFELAGGAIADFEDGCIPKAQREASFTIAALHQWDMSFNDPKCVHSAEEWIAETLAPVTVGGPFPSFLGRLEPPGRIIGCYGTNWSRLVEIKQKYDPQNVFKNSLWPMNAAGEIIDSEEHEPNHTPY
ncbi:hypothetical protein SERLA73DRAFT_86778 [Serpula lacrymans var. lacrymans S7.3]|uniref:FAD-binding PCMH-type domain-containing protein n=2 Tax=Serpula lacrymans var. lacrymans TaxID=341189 RepID=F8PRG1_SERL3|nr:uncharacterized protein SERLADRAFT_414308 [Serpula lacrymans var. lacrymans S7.9]EGO00584.1 hypothetical protein SERLA73DRAFT_86778 [Serpula lacrymans var. lacrymans S7.3]EGO26142.1 hypothetical protein SERLADRAFT_414308 [Serpula lacrymans var. lacrymans S7.9]